MLNRGRLASVMAGTLRERGTDDVAARLAGEVGGLAVSTAYARWAAPGNRQPCTEIACAVLRDLQARAASLGEGTAARA